MKRFIEGEDRHQVTLLPECLDDYIGEDNPVRVVDVFVDELDLHALGSKRTEPALTGRPAYHPGMLLKLYIYGYLNRIQSSRRLEREARRNVELMWLTGRLAPDFKTIADFRRNSGPGIRNVCKRFIAMCRQLKLFSQAIVAIDGSKFKAVNSRDCNFTPGKIDRRQEQIEQSIQRYLHALEIADRTQPAEVEAKTERLQEKIKKLREQMRRLDGLREQLKGLPDRQISLTDPDARSMTTQAKGSGLVGYNVQTVVDAEHHLIVAHEVTNVGNDRAQLHRMACSADQAMGSQSLQAFADRGYFSGSELKACEDAGITTFVPKPMTSNAKAEGRFDKADFIYIAKDDEYQCPAGKRAIYRFSTLEKSALKAQCTTSSYRRIRRWEHEEVLERVQQRLDRKPDAMTLRRSTVEHVFGTLKHWMGSTHFLMKTLKHVSTEMSLHVLAYNLKRVIGVLGIAGTMQAMRVGKA
ncbi:MAG: IS1182 family transposase [Comamonas sp.]|jgi:transposase|uniref:IS1182 family transposase n=1 Tax=Comamonas sp. TaxID=34028 RepID=UPI0028377FAA|nr:IS1182 family transposase [Comamonas sp.]MDR0213963.1 IS1182 family transposase [Comamonas sp.]